ncbi:ClpX C4-type zinc finger protein [Actinopolymorpha sp. B9G3]|uniref:ClpX C4-type zinc finger protein n=1 Tax=Actinopolymorpha sp. B9G3 TaxID=3158970 RepID=UPI0032D8EDD0
MSSTQISPSDLRCSFCNKSKEEVDRLVAGPAVFICDGCIRLAEQVIAEESGQLFGDLQSRSTEDLLASIARLDTAPDHVERAVAEHVSILRERGVTWARIGETLGISRQSAWERFSGEE